MSSQAKPLQTLPRQKQLQKKSEETWLFMLRFRSFPIDIRSTLNLFLDFSWKNYRYLGICSKLCVCVCVSFRACFYGLCFFGFVLAMCKGTDPIRRCQTHGRMAFERCHELQETSGKWLWVQTEYVAVEHVMSFPQSLTLPVHRLHAHEHLAKPFVYLLLSCGRIPKLSLFCIPTV